MDAFVPPVRNASVTVILNGRSGPSHTREQAEQLSNAFQGAGSQARIVFLEEGADPGERAREALREKPEVLVAAGGDGTVSAVANAVRGTGTTLGVLPLGTLNHFARDLGIPLELEAAVRVVVEGRRVAVDVGDVNGVCFINNASLGLYPDIVRERTRQQRRLGRSKRSAMLWATLAVLQRPPLLELRLDVDDEPRACRAPFVFVGNNDYVLEGFEIGRRERLDAGALNVYTTRACSAGGLVRLALRALFRRLRQDADFLESSARTLRVESRKPRLLVATDGEVRALKTPLEFRIVPHALQVMVP